MKKGIWKKRLLSIITVVLLIGVITAYTKITINAEVNEKTVFVTKMDIPPRTQITEEMLVKHTIPSRAIPLNSITDPDEIVGKWTVTGYGISKNSFIFKDKIVEQSELPDAGLLELKEGEIAVPLLVDLETSLGNSIIPNTNIDLYFRDVIYDENNPKAMLGTLAENIRVIAVKDSQATNVFDTKGNLDEANSQDITTTESTTLAKIYIFAVPTELGELINKGKLLGEVFPVATGLTYKKDIEVNASENEIVDYINQATFTKEKEEK